MNDRTVRGRSRDGRTYFLAEFSKSFTAFGTFKQIPPRHDDSIIGDSDVQPERLTITGPFAGAYVRYATTNGERVLVKIASGISYSAAEERLQKEDPEWDFDAVKHAAENAWRAKLNQVEVEGGTEKNGCCSTRASTIPSRAHT